MSTYDTFECEGWTTHKRAFLGRTPVGTSAIGWEFSRDECGCVIQLGMRLDKMEPVLGISACHKKHEKACTETIRYMTDHPPSDRDAVEMAIEFYEAWQSVVGRA